MSTLLLERSPVLDEGFGRDTSFRLDGTMFAGITDAHGRLTLDELDHRRMGGLGRARHRCLPGLRKSDDSPRPRARE